MQKSRILIVEDDAQIASLLNQALKEAGYETFVAFDGGMAANIIRVPHNPRPAACHLCGRAPTQPAPRPARSLRAQSFLALPAGASGAQVATQHAATACFKQSHSRSSTIPSRSIAALRRTSWRLPASRIQHWHASCKSVRCRLSRPHQVSCPLQTPLIAADSHAARRPPAIETKGILPRLRPHRAQVRHQAILPLRRRLQTSARSARALTQGVCRTERPTALRRERSRSTAPGELPAHCLRELASSQPFMHAGHS